MKEVIFMSMESAKLFVERIKNDEDFRNRVNECKDNETRKAFVSQQGFDFTGEDIEQDLRIMNKKTQ